MKVLTGALSLLALPVILVAWAVALGVAGSLLSIPAVFFGIAGLLIVEGLIDRKP